MDKSEDRTKAVVQRHRCGTKGQDMRQKSDDQQELKRRRAPLTCFEADGGILSGQSRESGLEKVDCGGVSGRESG